MCDSKAITDSVKRLLPRSHSSFAFSIILCAGWALVRNVVVFSLSAAHRHYHYVLATPGDIEEP